MKLILKILFAPVIAVLVVFIHLCALTLRFWNKLDWFSDHTD